MRDRKPLAPSASANVKRGQPIASLSPDIQARIGQQLRAYYAGLIEPTPDRFVELLQQLDKPQRSASGGNESSEDELGGKTSGAEEAPE